MDSNKKMARTAGILYLGMILTFSVSLGIIPGQFIVKGDVAATISKISASEWLFRLGIVVGMLACVIYMLQLFVLCKLLGPVSKTATVLMLAFGLAHLPLFFVCFVDHLNVLSLLHGGSNGSVLTTEQLHAQISLALNAYDNGMHVNELFMGIWLLPFGYLVFKSGFLPKILGALLIFNGLPYLIDFFRIILWPDYTLPSVVRYIMMPSVLGEFGTCLWLIIIGAKESAETRRPTAV